MSPSVASQAAVPSVVVVPPHGVAYVPAVCDGWQRYCRVCVRLARLPARDQVPAQLCSGPSAPARRPCVEGDVGQIHALRSCGGTAPQGASRCRWRRHRTPPVPAHPPYGNTLGTWACPWPPGQDLALVSTRDVLQTLARTMSLYWRRPMDLNPASSPKAASSCWCPAAQG